MLSARLSLIALIFNSGIVLGGPPAAQSEAPEAQTISGDPSFCLFELPEGNNGKRRWINLAIVQYVETARDEFKIVYGGGNLGSGYETRFPVSSPDEALGLLQKMRNQARACSFSVTRARAEAK